MIDANDKLLRDAVDRNVAAVLTLPDKGLLHHCKSRFLLNDPAGLWIESDPAQTALIDVLVAGRAPVAVSFKVGNQKVSFATTILRREPQYRVNDCTVLEALLLEPPLQVKSVQRRVDYRVRVGADSDLKARVWRISERADIRDMPMSAAELAVEMRDLSLGGMGVCFKSPDAKEPVRICSGERLRIVLTFGKDELLIEGRVRHLPSPKPGESVLAGVQFAKLTKDIKGRQKLAALTRIVGFLQREEVRRTRLGLAG